MHHESLTICFNSNTAITLLNPHFGINNQTRQIFPILAMHRQTPNRGASSALSEVLWGWTSAASSPLSVLALGCSIDRDSGLPAGISRLAYPLKLHRACLSSQRSFGVFSFSSLANWVPRSIISRSDQPAAIDSEHQLQLQLSSNSTILSSILPSSPSPSPWPT